MYGLEKDKILKITKTAQYIAGEGIVIKEPKSASSRREIVLSEGIVKLLKELKSFQTIEKFKLGEKLKDSDRIFTFHPDTISSYFSDFLKKNNLPKASIHSLRHGNISLQLYMGIDPKTASVRAGHSNVRCNDAESMHICRNQQIGLLHKNLMKHYHSILIISILKEKRRTMYRVYCPFYFIYIISFSCFSLLFLSVYQKILKFYLVCLVHLLTLIL